MECICLYLLQACDAPSVLAIPEIGAIHLPCSTTQRVTVLTVVAEKAGNTNMYLRRLLLNLVPPVTLGRIFI